MFEEQFERELEHAEMSNTLARDRDEELLEKFDSLYDEKIDGPKLEESDSEIEDALSDEELEEARQYMLKSKNEQQYSKREIHDKIQ